MKNSFKQRLLLGSITLTLAAPSAFGVTETFDTVTAPGFTWTCPAGVTSIQVECWGGGGAGGQGTKTTTAGTNTSQNGGGGGGGAYARNAAVPVTPGLSYTITIPTAAVNSVANGNSNASNLFVNGGTVTFVGDTSVTVTAGGGGGGQKCFYNE